MSECVINGQMDRNCIQRSEQIAGVQAGGKKYTTVQPGTTVLIWFYIKNISTFYLYKLLVTEK